MHSPYVHLRRPAGDDEGTGAYGLRNDAVTGPGYGAGRAFERDDIMDDIPTGAGPSSERIGRISRRLEDRALAHTPATGPLYPERHIAGAPDAGMAPGIPSRRDAVRGRLERAGRFTGHGAGRVARVVHDLRNRKQSGGLRPAEGRRQVERYVAGHPGALAGAAVAGFLLGRLVRR